MSKQLFDSRGKARKYAQKHGGKVKDRGKFFDKERWAVEGSGAEAPDVGSLVTIPCKTRGEARELKAKHNGKIIDYTKGKGEHIVRDLEKKGKRWAVQYRESVAATPEDEAIYKKIADDYLVDTGRKIATAEEATAPEPGIATPAQLAEVVAEVEPIVIMTLKNISVTLGDGKQLVMSRDHEDFKTVAGLFADGDVAAMVEIMNVEKKKREWSFGKDICVIDGKLYHYGMVVPQTSIARRIINDCEAGQDPVKFVNFFRKLMQNPSFKAVQHTYDFIEHNDLEILEDGNIRAWKKVTIQGLATKGVPNFKGMTIMMPRNQVEDDPSKTCSAGLHVAAKEYFNHLFKGGLLIEVSVSPADIVSVPTDYNNSKCRTCRYEILTGLERPADVPQVLIIDKDGNKLQEIDTDE